MTTIYEPVKRAKDTPLAAIHAYCKWCLGEVLEDGVRSGDGLTPGKDCRSKECPLYDFRTGRNPFAKGKMSKEQRDAARNRLAKAREA